MPRHVPGSSSAGHPGPRRDPVPSVLPLPSPGTTVSMCALIMIGSALVIVPGNRAITLPELPPTFAPASSISRPFEPRSPCCPQFEHCRSKTKTLAHFPVPASTLNPSGFADFRETDPVFKN